MGSIPQVYSKDDKGPENRVKQATPLAENLGMDIKGVMYALHKNSGKEAYRPENTLFAEYNDRDVVIKNLSPDIDSPVRASVFTMAAERPIDMYYESQELESTFLFYRDVLSRDMGSWQNARESSNIPEDLEEKLGSCDNQDEYIKAAETYLDSVNACFLTCTSNMEKSIKNIVDHIDIAENRGYDTHLGSNENSLFHPSTISEMLEEQE